MKLVGHELEFTTLPEMVRGRAALGEKPFMWIGDDVLTYAEAHLRSNRFANALDGMGVRKGDIVATYLYNSIDHLCLWFACAKLGAIRASFNISLQPTELDYTLRDTSARIIILEEELVERYLQVRGRQDIQHEVLFGRPETAERLGMTHASILAAGEPSEVNVEVLPHDPANIVYSGGSTGMPKGVLVPNLYHIAFGVRFREIAQAVPTDVMYDCGHLFHLGHLGVIGPMYSGMTSVMTRWFSVSRLWDLLNRHAVNLLHVPGTMLGPILDATPEGGGPDHPIKLALGMGTGQIKREIRDQFEQRFGFPLLEVYAGSEMGALLSSERLGDQRAGSSGHPYGWADVRIVDEADRPLPAGEEGEIVTRPTEPHTFMIGYFNKPDMTATTWRNLWHHTGDLGYLDKDGFLYFKGRKAFWIRRRGENVAAFEVEQVIAQHPLVAECAVVGVPSEIGDEEVKAYIIARGEGTLDPSELIAWCQERLSNFKVPRYLEFVKDLPRTAAKQEIQRAELKKRGIGQAWDRDAAVAPRVLRG